MFTLKLVIMGLVGLVPADDGFVFVLPNVSHADMRDMVHVPMLACNPGTVCSVEGGEDEWDALETALKINPGDDTVGLRLQGETLTLVGAEPGPLAKPSARRYGLLSVLFGACPKSPTAAQSLSWLPELSRVEPNAAAIDPVHLRQPDPEVVAALLPLSVRGTLRAYSYPLFKVGNGKEFVRSFTFKRRGKRVFMTRRHAAPDVLEVTIPIAESAAQIRLQPFSGEGASRTLTIKPESAGGEAVVLLGNLTPMGEDKEEPVGSEIAHFELYYKLSKLSPAPATNGTLKVPHIGRRHVKANKVNPLKIHAILGIVSTQSPPAGGFERPVCTFTSFTAPPTGK